MCVCVGGERFVKIFLITMKRPRELGKISDWCSCKKILHKLKHFDLKGQLTGEGVDGNQA